MNLSDEDYLFKTTEKFADWAQSFFNASLCNIPKKQLKGLNDYGQDEIFGFKMMASFSLELYMKAYLYTLIHKNYSNKKFTNHKELQEYLEKRYTHSLKRLKDYIIKEDASFKSVDLDKAITWFDCFDEIRYPTPSKNHNQIIGLFEYNDDMKIIYLKTYQFLREECNKYITNINQERTTELEHESEMAEAWSEYKYNNEQEPEQ